MKERCRACGLELEIKGKYHAGFSQVGFLYCDRDQAVLTFGIYDERLLNLVPGNAPWAFTDEEKKLVEDHLLDCPCGGRFSFRNPLICPECGGAFANPMSLDDIYFAVIGPWIDGEKADIWTSGGESK